MVEERNPTSTTRYAKGLPIIAVNPGSMLGSKMVKQAFGVAGGDIRIGVEILTRAALSDEFAAAPVHAIIRQLLARVGWEIV